MFLDPFVLANKITQKAGRKLSGPALTRLAWALSNGQGVAREGKEMLLVLTHPLAYQEFKLVAARDGSSLAARKARSFEQVRGTFRNHCGSLSTGKPPNDELWLPVLTGRAQRLKVGGSLPQPVHTEQQDYGVDWYDPMRIEVGKMIFFATKNRDLSVYQRIGPDHFALAQVPAAQNLVNMRQIIQRLSSADARVEGITPLAGDHTLMRPPP